MKLAWMLLLAASLLALGCDSLNSHHKSKNIAPDSAQWVARENFEKLSCTTDPTGAFEWEGGNGNGDLISWSTVCVKGVVLIRAKEKITFESELAKMIEEFKKDPPGQLELIHVGSASCLKGQSLFVMAMIQAALDTGHPIKFGVGAVTPTHCKINWTRGNR